MIKKSDFLTIPQLAKLLGFSRIAIYKRVKKGEIPAKKVGRMYVIPHSYVDAVLGKALRAEDKKKIELAVNKTIKEYGEVLKMLGRE